MGLPPSTWMVRWGGIAASMSSTSKGATGLAVLLRYAESALSASARRSWRLLSQNTPRLPRRTWRSPAFIATSRAARISAKVGARRLIRWEGK